MFNLGLDEIALLGIIALIVLGPKQLPEVARSIGRLLNEFKRATGDLTNVIVDAREATQKSLLEAREEYNKVIENAAAVADSSAATSAQPEPTHEHKTVIQNKTLFEASENSTANDNKDS